MKILVVRPYESPTVAIVETLADMQEIVGGYIQVIYPFDEPVALVCNEEGRLRNLDVNITVPKYGTIFGTFFICGLDGDDFASLSDEKIKRFSDWCIRLRRPIYEL